MHIKSTKVTIDTNNKRYLPFDLVRAICVLYIVCIWHLNSYLSNEYKFSGETLRFLHCVTESILGAFTFLSGYFLKRYIFSSFRDVLSFYGKRLKRFYLLLLLSALTYLVLSWVTISQFLQVMVGTNLLFGDAVGTLWYFSMIILFYILTPLLSFKRNEFKWWLPLSSLCVFGVFCVLVYFTEADYRMLLYFPCYIIGLSTNKLFENNKVNGVLLLLVVISYAIVYMLNLHDEIVFRIIMTQFGVWTVILLCVIICTSKCYTPITFISTASMVAYLFHRQVFSLCRNSCESFFHINYIPLGGAIILSILFFIVSYYIQIIYNHLINKLWPVKKKSV